MSKILVVDGHPVVRYGLRHLLESDPDICVIGDCGNGDSALPIFEESRPDLIVMGLNLVGPMNAAVVCNRIKNTPEPPRVLIHAAYNLPDNICRCLLAGADSFLHKSVTCQRLLEAIHKTLAGERLWITGEHVEQPKLGGGFSEENVRLTFREREILALMASHYTDMDIAQELHICQPTVKSHTRSVLKKLGLTNRRQIFSPPSG